MLAACQAAPSALPAQHMMPPQVVESDINVSATATVSITPDRARLTIGVQTDAPTAAAAGAENARRATAIQAALTGKRIAGLRVTTTGYRVEPQQRWDQPEQVARVIGYRVQNTVVVVVPDPAQVGPLIDAALGAGATNIASIEFFLADPAPARRDALTQAMEQAKAEAAVLAKAAGGRLGVLRSVSVQEDNSGGPMPMMMMRGAVADAAPQTPITPGDQHLRVTVQTRWTYTP